MISEAVSLAGPRENLTFEVADVEHLPFRDGRFTAVLCSNAFHHYPHPWRAVSEMTRVVAPGGRLAIGDATSDLVAARIADRFLRWFEPGHVRLHRAAELGALVTDAGLERVQFRRIGDGAFAIARGVKP